MSVLTTTLLGSTGGTAGSVATGASGKNPASDETELRADARSAPICGSSLSNVIHGVDGGRSK